MVRDFVAVSVFIAIGDQALVQKVVSSASALGSSVLSRVYNHGVFMSVALFAFVLHELCLGFACCAWFL